MVARVLAAVGVGVAVLLLWRLTYIVNEGEVALRTRFGHIEGAQYSPGLHLKSPWDEVHVLDRRIVTRAYPGENFLTRDQKSLSVDFYVKWQLLNAERFFQATGGDEDMAGQRLADIIRDRLKSAVAGQPLTTVIAASRGTLSDAGYHDIGAAALELGVQLIDVQLQRVDLTDDVASAAEYPTLPRESPLDLIALALHLEAPRAPQRVVGGLQGAALSGSRGNFDDSRGTTGLLQVVGADRADLLANGLRGTLAHQIRVVATGLHLGLGLLIGDLCIHVLQIAALVSGGK